MINIWTDPLFRLGIGYLAAQQAVSARTERYERFQQFMVKLREAQEQPIEVQSMTGPYMRIPLPEVRAVLAAPVMLKETVRDDSPPSLISPWDKNRNIWIRWHPENQKWMVMRNPPKPQGRLA